MFCKYCGTALEDAVNICNNCGKAQAEAFAAPPATLPAENRPLSAWAYWGLQILFAVPVVGFIFLIIFSFNGSNINRRNFARSYWCSLLILAVIAIVVIVLAITLGGAREIMSQMM